MVNHINAFLNTKLIENDNSKTSYLETAGNLFLTPIRDLTKGGSYTVIRERGAFKKLDVSTPTRSLVKGVLPFITYVPAILLGTLFKGLAQFSSNAREHHTIAAIKNTVIERKDVADMVSDEELLKELDDPYRRRIKTFVI